MVPLTINWIKTDITKNIVHPAHIPLVVEAHAPHIGWLGNIRPGSGFLGNHQSLRIELKHGLVQLMEEINSLQIAVTTIFVRHPISVLPTIVQIKHIGHCIYPQSINMILLHPKQGIGNQKTLYLSAAIIKIYSSPAGIIGPLDIIRLI